MAETHQKEEAPEEGINIQSKTGKKSKIPRWLKILLIAMAAVIILFIGLVLFVNNTTKEVADKASTFTSYLVKNDVADAYAMTSKGFKASTTQDQLKQYFDQLYQVFGNGEIKLAEKQIATSTETGNNGVVIFTINKDGKTYWAKIQLIKEDGEWRVINFATSQNKLEAKIE